MPNDCDPACQKIIINSGLVAISADLLAAGLPEGDPLAKAAIELRDASRALVDTYDYLTERGVMKTAKTKSKWNGCPEASEVMVMVVALNPHSALADRATAFIERLHELRDETVSYMTEMIGSA